MASKKSPARAARAKSAPKAKLPKKAKPAAAAAAPAPATVPQKTVQRESSKLANVIAMLRSPEGATIAAIMSATGWQAHSVRGAISGAIKKKLGLTVTSEANDDGRCYRIPAEG